MAGAVDPKVVRPDSYVLGYSGYTDRAVYGRVMSISAHGWITVWMDNEPQIGSKQTIMYPGRFVVKGPPRPENQRTDIPEKFRR
jgi:hypothetical protein